MKAKGSVVERPIVQTVKLEPGLFVRLKTFGARPAGTIRTFCIPPSLST